MATSLKPMSQFKLWLILLTLSAGPAIILINPMVALVSSAGFDPRFAVVPFTLLLLGANGFLFYYVGHSLHQMNVALVALNDEMSVSPIPVSSGNLLKPLIDPVNALIQERVDLKTMRGKLVGQISAAAAQEERNRLARDLHDSIKQQVFTMSISAAAAHAHLDTNPAAAREALLDVKQSAQEAMIEMRALLQQLSPAPLEKSGLIQALRDQCEALAYRTGAKVETQFGELPPDDRLPTGAQEELFRIAQEALSNIARHARAQHVHLTLNAQDEQALVMTLTDNGQGFDPAAAPAGMGMGNMRTRATGIGASMSLDSAPGQGTTLIVTIPLIAQISEEEQMNTHFEPQVSAIAARYVRIAVAATAFIISFSLLLWRLLARPERITEDAVLTVILIVLIITAVGSLPVALLQWGQARRESAVIIQRAGRESRSAYKLARHETFVLMMISFILAWFLPILMLGLEVNQWLGVGVGALLLGGGIGMYTRMSELYKRELNVLRPAQRADELTKRLAEIRGSWVSVGLSAGVIVASTLVSSNFQIPPQEPDHWMNLSFITAAVLLISNQIISRQTYLGWLRQTTQEKAYP